MFKIFNLKVKKREFGYKPRYYDEDKEELSERIRTRLEENKDGAGTKSRIRKEFSHLRHQPKVGKKSAGAAPFYRLVIILVALILLTSFILNQWLPKLMTALFPEQQEQYEVLDRFEDFD
jgi:hypothetical protein